MATMSIEILCVGATAVLARKEFSTLCLDVSSPPRSDRDPSLWESHMLSEGGSLVHLFDCDDNAARRWAYEIVDEIEWTTFRFRVNLREFILELLRSLVNQSPVHTLWFYSDAQWSNEPEIRGDELTLSEFQNLHDLAGLRMNTAYKIKEFRFI